VATVQNELSAMRQSERVVICHSLGCMAWLHLAAAGYHRLPVDRIVFVAPPSNAYLATEPALTAFQVPAAWRVATVATSIEVPRLVCSDDDPYCKEGARHAYPVGFDVDLLSGAGHLDMPAGYGPWPSLLAWCLNHTTRVQTHTQALAPAVAVDHAQRRLKVAVLASHR
jgi:predicted alpha/beta hydrolase family esterase